jgi:hypothetical protein
MNREGSCQIGSDSLPGLPPVVRESEAESYFIGNGGESRWWIIVCFRNV